jgi:hypothetical protein
VSFGGNSGVFPNEWGNQTAYMTVATDYSLMDNVQYVHGSISDAFNSTGNTAYNALQVSLTDRTPIRGLTFSLNWTWEKEMDDVGTYCSGYERRSAEWSPGTSTIPQQITAFAVYDIVV